MQWKMGFEFEFLSKSRHDVKVHMREMFGPTMGNKIQVMGDLSVSGPVDMTSTEVVTPPLPEKEAKYLMTSIFDYMKEERVVTNRTTGLHINLSCSDRDRKKFSKVNPELLIAASDDLYIASKFRREKNEYCIPWPTVVKGLCKKVSIDNKKSKVYRGFDLKKEYSDLVFNIYNDVTIDDDSFYSDLYYPHKKVLSDFSDKYITFKYMSINIGHMKYDGYVEYRMIGGKDYHHSEDVIDEAIEHFKLGQSIAYRNEDHHLVDRYLEWAQQ